MIEFDDWLEHRSMDESWTTVAQHDVTECNGWKSDLFMTSVLAPTNSFKTLLANSKWLTTNDFGNAEVGAGGEQIKVQTEDNIGENQDVRIEPFTFLMGWNDTWPSRFELIQNFILFYNLHLNAKDSKYVAVDGAGETTDVVRIRDEEEHKKIEIRTKFLRNYLACRGLVLVRQHDNRIHADITLAELGIEPFKGRKLEDFHYRFDLAVVDGGLSGKGPAVGLLMGKDLVLSHCKCQDLLGFPKGDCEFIVGVDAHGENIMGPCAERVPEMYLTPVYFERDVLKKYNRYSTKYEVSHGMVSCGAHWGVRIHQNGDQVMVFLGDLASLPANEQTYWKDYNVPPNKAALERDIKRDGDGPFEIPKREDKRNEFKETFSVPVKDGKSDAVKEEVAITVAAFANTEGGRLFIGVNDKGEPAGLEKDLKKYGDFDKLELAIQNYIHTKLAVQVDMDFNFIGEDYLVISVTKRRRSFVYVGNNFYIRSGNSSRGLSPRETAEYQYEYRSA